MRHIVGAILLFVFAWWGFVRLTAGPPEAVVGEFLRAVQGQNWWRAQAYMTQHIQGRLGREGFGAAEQFVRARLEQFQTFEIVRTVPRGDEADVVVRLRLPVSEWPGGEVSPQAVGAHTNPGRVEGDQFIHAHRFQLQREGLGAWRIYQFEEVDGR